MANGVGLPREDISDKELEKEALIEILAERLLEEEAKQDVREKKAKDFVGSVQDTITPLLPRPVRDAAESSFVQEKLTNLATNLQDPEFFNERGAELLELGINLGFETLGATTAGVPGLLAGATAGDIVGPEVSQGLGLRPGTAGEITPEEKRAALLSLGINTLFLGGGQLLQGRGKVSQKFAERPGAIGVTLRSPAGKVRAEKALASELEEGSKVIAESEVFKGGSVFDVKANKFIKHPRKPPSIRKIKENMDGAIPALVAQREVAFTGIDAAMKVLHKAKSKSTVGLTSFPEFRKKRLINLLNQAENFDASVFTKEAGDSIRETVSKLKSDFNEVFNKATVSGTKAGSKKQLLSPNDLQRLISNVDFRLKELRAFDPALIARSEIDPSVAVQFDRLRATLLQVRGGLKAQRNDKITEIFKAANKSNEAKELLEGLSPELVQNLNTNIRHLSNFSDAIDRFVSIISAELVSARSAIARTEVLQNPIGGALTGVARKFGRLDTEGKLLAEEAQAVEKILEIFERRVQGAPLLERLGSIVQTPVGLESARIAARVSGLSAEEATRLAQAARSGGIVPEEETSTLTFKPMALNKMSDLQSVQEGIVNASVALQVRGGAGLLPELNKEGLEVDVPKEVRDELVAEVEPLIREDIGLLSQQKTTFGESSEEFKSSLAQFSKKYSPALESSNSGMAGEVVVNNTPFLPLPEDRRIYDKKLQIDSTLSLRQKSLMRSALRANGEVISKPKDLSIKNITPEEQPELEEP